MSSCGQRGKCEGGRNHEDAHGETERAFAPEGGALGETPPELPSAVQSPLESSPDQEIPRETERDSGDSPDRQPAPERAETPPVQEVLGMTLVTYLRSIGVLSEKGAPLERVHTGKGLETLDTDSLGAGELFDDLAGLNTLAELGVFTGENIDESIERANSTRKPEILSFLMNYKNAETGITETDYEL